MIMGGSSMKETSFLSERNKVNIKFPVLSVIRYPFGEKTDFGSIGQHSFENIIEIIIPT